jgi:hypothetical protein
MTKLLAALTATLFAAGVYAADAAKPAAAASAPKAKADKPAAAASSAKAEAKKEEPKK